MKDLLDKISSYNLFNYLLPGVLFACLSESIIGHSLIQTDIVVGVFFYYFLGMTISRIGSLIVEPFAKFIRLVKYVDYKRYIDGCKLDERIDLMSEVNNTYRTLVSVFLTLGILRFYIWLESVSPHLGSWRVIILVVLLLVLYALAYRKQSQYVTKRIEISEKSPGGIIKP